MGGCLSTKTSSGDTLPAKLYIEKQSETGVATALTVENDVVPSALQPVSQQSTQFGRISHKSASGQHTPYSYQSVSGPMRPPITDKNPTARFSISMQNDAPMARRSGSGSPQSANSSRRVSMDSSNGRLEGSFQSKLSQLKAKARGDSNLGAKANSNSRLGESSSKGLQPEKPDSIQLSSNKFVTVDDMIKQLEEVAQQKGVSLQK